MSAKQAAKRKRKNKKKSANDIFRCVFVIVMLLSMLLFANEHWFHIDFIPTLTDIYKMTGVIKRPNVVVEQDEIAVHFLDVGQADCIFIYTPDKTMLIDSGENDTSQYVISYLRDFGVKRLDYVIGTHQHSDHMGAMAEILRAFEVGEFIMPEIPEEQIPAAAFYSAMLDVIEDKKISASYSENGREITLCEGTVLKLLGPVGDNYEDLNDYSIVAKLTSGNFSFLFTGDMEKIAEQHLLMTFPDIKADVLKVAHHGSASSSCTEFLLAVRPQYAVISAGRNNSYGHPSNEVLERLCLFNCTNLVTMNYGDIVFVTDGNELTYTTTRYGEGEAA